MDGGRAVLATTAPGDVIFFHGHLFHWSGPNRSADRLRRSLVCHYADARSYTEWGAMTWRDGATGTCTNGEHILARGDTHLPFGKPKFGTPCAATAPTR